MEGVMCTSTMHYLVLYKPDTFPPQFQGLGLYLIVDLPQVLHDGCVDHLTDSEGGLVTLLNCSIIVIVFTIRISLGFGAT